MNLNKLAKEIALREGKRKSVSIAQVKEILRHLGDIFYEDSLRGLDIASRMYRAAEKRKK